MKRSTVRILLTCTLLPGCDDRTFFSLHELEPVAVVTGTSPIGRAALTRELSRVAELTTFVSMLCSTLTRPRWDGAAASSKSMRLIVDPDCH